jgi:hypothetical protein
VRETSMISTAVVESLLRTFEQARPNSVLNAPSRVEFAKEDVRDTLAALVRAGLIECRTIWDIEGAPYGAALLQVTESGRTVLERMRTRRRVANVDRAIHVRV